MQQVRGQLRWSFCNSAAVSAEFVESWQRLNSLFVGQNPALDLKFFEVLIKYFGVGTELVGVCRSDGALVASVIIRPSGFGSWLAFVPGQACLSPLLVDRRCDVTAVLDSLLRALPGLNWQLTMFKIDPHYIGVDQVMDQGHVEVSTFGTTYSVNVDQPFEYYWNSRSKGLRYKLRKLFKKIDEQKMTVSFSLEFSPKPVDDFVATHGALENSGWKGIEGTALSPENIQGRFYRDLLAEFGADHETIIAQLRFDEEPVASLLCIGRGDKIIVLKTAYQRKWSDLSPGRLIDYFFLKRCCEDERFKIVDMYTRASKSDLSWSSDTREMYDLSLFRNGVFKFLAISTRNFRQRLRNALHFVQ